MSDTPHPAQRLFGRRKGRPLRARKSRLMEELLPKLTITLPEQGFLDPAALFPSPVADIHGEIGFGGGEHLAAQALRAPGIGFLGCEPFLNGIAAMLDHIERQGIANIRIHPGDARLLLDALPGGCLGRVYVLFADPWPKARHAGRRFIGPENLPRLARCLRPGGELILATDVAALAAWMQAAVAASPDFEAVAITTEPPANWCETRYEQKGRAAGRLPVYFTYRRRSS